MRLGRESSGCRRSSAFAPPNDRTTCPSCSAFLWPASGRKPSKAPIDDKWNYILERNDNSISALLEFDLTASGVENLLAANEEDELPPDEEDVPLPPEREPRREPASERAPATEPEPPPPPPALEPPSFK